MGKCFKKILPCFTAFAMVISFALVPAHAEYQSVTVGLFQRLIRSYTADVSDYPLLGSVLASVVSSASRSVCGVSDDQLHHAESYTGTATAADGTPVMTCRCKYCNQEFWAYPEDLSAAYDAYVSDLPVSGYTSSGGLIWHVFDSFTGAGEYGYYIYSTTGHRVNMVSGSSLPFIAAAPESRFKHKTFYSLNTVNRSLSFSSHDDDGASSCFAFGYRNEFPVPISGSYRRLASPDYRVRRLVNGSYVDDSNDYKQENSFAHRAAGGTVSVYSLKYYLDCTFATGSFYFPVYEIIPDTAISGDVYNIATRPTSITGGNYGIVGDNGQIVKVEDNSTIVNETNNTYFNPATGQTVPITGWNYDYSDRSYTVTTEAGDTVTVTYGDENITIKEGDTVYNVYYLADGGGSETPVDPPTDCDHIWTETSRTEPTCTAPGKAFSTCSKCQQTKTEAVPALGHDWQVKQTVTTEYDDAGQLVQEGYILYECSRCQEQYKSTGGAAPPGGEGDSTTIGGLIEKLLGGVGDVVKGMIKGILTFLTKAVEALQGIGELFTSFVSSVVGIFGSFTDFLSAVFPFLPGEFVTIIELGLLLLVAAAVLRKFLS